MGEDEKKVSDIPMPDGGRFKDKKWLMVTVIGLMVVVAIIVLIKVLPGKKDEPDEVASNSTTASQEGSANASQPGKTEASTGSGATNAADPSKDATKPTDSKPDESKQDPNGTEPTKEDPEQPTGKSELNTGNLSAYSTTYEGTKGTGDFNYGEALQKSLLFYELQRSGALPDEVRCNWRGDSGLEDGKSVGLDLTGGLYDAGDNMKFNLPMAYTGAMLAWSVYEDRASYVESGQLEYALGNIRWINDYLIKCHPEPDVYYYQIGDAGSDHGWWGPCEVMQMDRPVYKVDKSSPGSCVAGQAAASLAAASVVFKDSDPTYSALYLKHAKELYAFADSTRSDAGYTAANGFYSSWSGFWDELCWSATWLYIATGDDAYLSAAKNAAKQTEADLDWAMCWDNSTFGANLLLARITGEKAYKDEIEHHLDTWTVGYNGKKVTYSPKGMAFIDGWGNLRYSTTTAFLALIYSRSDVCPADKKKIYHDFGVAQINYALGSSGRSFVIGFGENPPEHPHHRTAHGSYADNQNEPANHRHTLFGALVGGPDASDNYRDVVSDYNMNEVACDYNAGFTGALAALYAEFKGQTLKDFGAVEKITDDELYVEAGANVKGQDFIEIKAYIYNKTAYPARVTDKLELRYYMDLSEVYAAGGSAADLQLTNNYMAAGALGGIYAWDEEKHIYYASIDFTGAKIYPGGQSSYKKEVQFRIRNAGGIWDDANDPSFASIASVAQGQVTRAASLALYDDGKLVFGTEPASGSSAGKQVVLNPNGNQNQGGQGNQNQGGQGNQNQGGQGGTVSPSEKAASSAVLTVENTAGAMQANGNTISMMLKITNKSDGYLDVKDLAIEYYFTKDAAGGLSFWNDYSSISSGGYSEMKGVTGTFADAKGTDADTVCKIQLPDAGKLGKGGELQVQIRITKSDWSNFNLANDYSTKSVKNIVITNKGEVVFGTRP